VPVDGTACDDSSACTAADTCAAGACRGTAIAGCCAADAECDDGDPCTVDACSGNACQSVARDCSVADRCLAGFCNLASGACVTAPVSCDDSNVCTDDSCDPETGCASVPTANPPEPEELSCTDTADNDCDGAIDSADPSCATCGSGALCSAQDAAAFAAFIPSSFTALMPTSVCVPRSSWGSFALHTETCFTSGCGPSSGDGCRVLIHSDGVSLAATPTEIPFEFTLRTQYDLTMTVPLSVRMFGTSLGTCNVIIQANDLVLETTGRADTRNGGCTLGPQVLGATQTQAPTVSYSGCSLFDVVDFATFYANTVDSAVGHLVIGAIYPALDQTTAACPVQP
jgi:hypothetical protein